MRFYELMYSDFDKEGGYVATPKGTVHGLINDAEPPRNDYKDIYYSLVHGVYRDFMGVTSGGNIVSEELKNVIEQFIPSDYPIEFLPITIHSDLYGDRVYYFLHFTKIFDVINLEDCDCGGREKTMDNIIKTCLDAEKVEGLPIFNSRPYIGDVIISDDLKKAIKRRKLDKGASLLELRVSSSDRIIPLESDHPSLWNKIKRALDR